MAVLKKGLRMTGFEKDLATLINRYSKENKSNTPDIMLAEYLSMCLVAFTTITKRRDIWYNICNQIALVNTTRLMGCACAAVSHIGKPIAHVVDEIIVGTSPTGSEHLCQGKCKYSPGLIDLDRIKIHAERGMLLSISDINGNITDVTPLQIGLTGKIDAQGNYTIDFSNFGKELRSAFITYDYEYDLPPADNDGK